MHKLYDLTLYLPNISAGACLLGVLLAAILYKVMFGTKPYLQAEQSMIFIHPLLFVLSCFIISLVCIGVYGVFAIIKYFGLLGL